MTEQEWLTATNPRHMLVLCHGKASERRAWLFVVTCFRRVWPEVEEPVQRAVEVTERFVEGLATQDEMRVGGNEIDTFGLHDAWSTAFEALNYCQDSASPNAEPERLVQAALLRDIFGNQYRPVAVDPQWLTSDVVALAEGIYQERAFDRMPILADALQDAGCESENILTHCRQPGVHVRGCWVVDLLLGKE
jgi:hypothetical protein